MTGLTFEEALAHHGVKGQKWGVRKGDITPSDTTFGIRTHSELVLTKKLKNGGELNVIEKGFNDKSPTSRWFIKHVPFVRNNRQKVHSFILKNKSGVTVGSADFFENPKAKSMYLADIKISPEHRRNGYARATLEAGIAYGKEKNYNTLEMISSPMGAPLYASLGFKPTYAEDKIADVNKEVKNNDEAGWAEYTMDISGSKIKHADTDTGISRFAEILVQYVDAATDLNPEEDAMTKDSSHDDFMDGEDFLAHMGVKGMHWGQRKTDYAGADRKTNRLAGKDASEFSRAKMFYGEGAGTRRKLIKAKVEARAKTNPTYKAAFDHHLARQDLGKHADKAQSERQRKNVGKKAGQAARGVNRHINGPFAGSIAAVAAVGAYSYIHKNGYDAQIIQNGKNVVERLLR